MTQPEITITMDYSMKTVIQILENKYNLCKRNVDDNTTYYTIQMYSQLHEYSSTVTIIFNCMSNEIKKKSDLQISNLNFGSARKECSIYTSKRDNICIIRGNVSCIENAEIVADWFIKYTYKSMIQKHNSNHFMPLHLHQ